VPRARSERPQGARRASKPTGSDDYVERCRRWDCDLRPNASDEEVERLATSKKRWRVAAWHFDDSLLPTEQAKPGRTLNIKGSLEEELPTLREAAEKNAIARRTVLGTLHAQHVTNHAQMSALAQRAHAPVDEASVEWKLAEQTASLCIAKTCSQEKDVPPPPPEEEDEEAAATAIAPAPPPLPPPVETIAAPPSTIPELQWLRCPASDAWQPHARRAEHLLGSATRAV
jgi:hypothetical protein